MHTEHLNIAMLGHKHIPSREGGIEIVVEELSARMVERGHVVTCYNRSGHHISGRKFDGRKINEYKGIKLKSVFTVNRKGLAALSSSFFGAICCTLKNYDIVHFHAEGPASMCWLPKLFGKRIIVTIHGLDWQRTKWGRVASWYIHTGEKKAAQYADEIIVLSQNVKDYFKEKYERETILIPNGVNIPTVRPAEMIKDVWGLEKDSYVLFLGRLVPEKGIHYLIEAFSNIKTDKKLVIAGGSSDTTEYVNYLKSMSPKNIIFTGYVQGRLLEELYSNSYIYCLPSDLEGMPLSLLEAMSYGNCCLVSSIAECLEVVENNAFVFEKGNVKHLHEILIFLINNENLVRKYKDKAAKFVLEKYTWNDVVDKTLNVYHG